jgi:hypothetical protein
MPIGNSVGFALPKEAAARLKVEKGDVIPSLLTATAAPYDPRLKNSCKQPNPSSKSGAMSCVNEPSDAGLGLGRERCRLGDL